MRADNPNIAPMSDSWLEPDDEPECSWCGLPDLDYDHCNCDEDDDDEV